MLKSYAKLFILVWPLIAIPSQAQQVLQSGNQQISLLELYTSEGCSSCPPADRYLSSLVDKSDLWQRFVPVGFHVDYWDYIGWPDPFAQRKYSDRQRRHAREGHSRTVYTPGLFAAGSEWRAWRFGGRVPTTGKEVGDLRLELSNGRFNASFDPMDERGQQAKILTVALLGFGLSTQVPAGENRGKLLRHDFVVLGSKSFRSNQLNWRGDLPVADASHSPKRTAWAAWVQTPDSIKPLQAVGGWSAL